MRRNKEPFFYSDMSLRSVIAKVWLPWLPTLPPAAHFSALAQTTILGLFRPPPNLPPTCSVTRPPVLC